MILYFLKIFWGLLYVKTNEENHIFFLDYLELSPQDYCFNTHFLKRRFCVFFFLFYPSTHLALRSLGEGETLQLSLVSLCNMKNGHAPV